MLRIPVVCPNCGKEHLAAVPAAIIAAALAKDDRVHLDVTPRNFRSAASPAEIKLLLDYMANAVKCPAGQPCVQPMPG
jgi:hypothetical protein